MVFFIFKKRVGHLEVIFRRPGPIFNCLFDIHMIIIILNPLLFNPFQAKGGKKGTGKKESLKKGVSASGRAVEGLKKGQGLEIRIEMI